MKPSMICERLAILTVRVDYRVMLACPGCGWTEVLDTNATLSDVVIAETRHVAHDAKRATDPGE